MTLKLKLHFQFTHKRFISKICFYLLLFSGSCIHDTNTDTVNSLKPLVSTVQMFAYYVGEQMMFSGLLCCCGPLGKFNNNKKKQAHTCLWEFSGLLVTGSLLDVMR